MKDSVSGMLSLTLNLSSYPDMTFILAMHPKAATQESPGVPAISCEKTAHFLLPLRLHSAPLQMHLRVKLSENNLDCELLPAKSDPW